MVYKILRKLHLGNPTLSMAAPFLRQKAALPSEAEALTLLSALSPDPGSSCLCKDSAPEDRHVELDIIIPCYNAEKYVKRCLDSALSQKTKHSFRLIVINDGSTDSTPQIIDSYPADERLLIVHQENRGFSGARNAGLRLSKADYIMFLDSDDFIPEGSIEALMDCACKNKAGIVEGSYTTVDTAGKTLGSFVHKSGAMDLRRDMWGFTCMKIISSRLFDGLQFPEGYWYEDSIMSQMIYPLAQKLELTARGISDFVYCYTVNPAGISRTGRMSPKSIDSLWISLRLYEDREKLGLEKDEDYFRYLLNMLVLTYRRTEQQSTEAKKCIFVLWREFILKEFSAFESKDHAKSILLRAVREGNYSLYALACRLI